MSEKKAPCVKGGLWGGPTVEIAADFFFFFSPGRAKVSPLHVAGAGRGEQAKAEKCSVVERLRQYTLRSPMEKSRTARQTLNHQTNTARKSMCSGDRANERAGAAEEREGTRERERQKGGEREREEGGALWEWRKKNDTEIHSSGFAQTQCTLSPYWDTLYTGSALVSTSEKSSRGNKMQRSECTVPLKEL